MKELTLEELKYILDIMSMHDDCGPIGEGWQSKKLKDMIERIIELIKSKKQ